MQRLICCLLLVLSYEAPAQTPTLDLKCHEKNFWSLGYDGAIIRWLIDQDSISYDDTVTAASPLQSIAFCNAFNSAIVPRTFYGSDFLNSDSLFYFDGIQWLSLPAANGFHVANAAGYASHLYYTGISNGSSFLDNLLRFDGTQLTSICSVNPDFFSFADFAVDAYGNSWIVRGPQASQSDSILVIAPDGTRLRAFAFSENTTNGYGAFMLGGVLYLALGSGNSVYPNSLLALSFAGDSATIESIIPFPNSDFIDLASCSPGSPLILPANAEIPELNMNVYPNPFTTKIHFPNFDDRIIDQLILRNEIGMQLLSLKDVDAWAPLNLERLNDGIYFLYVSEGKQTTIKKLVKISE